MQEALGLTSNRVYYWRLLLEEYSPEITYIKGVDNTVANLLSRLEYDPKKTLNLLIPTRGFAIFNPTKS